MLDDVQYSEPTQHLRDKFATPLESMTFLEIADVRKAPSTTTANCSRVQSVSPTFQNSVEYHPLNTQTTLGP